MLIWLEASNVENSMAAISAAAAGSRTLVCRRPECGRYTFAKPFSVNSAAENGACFF
jgi:hypothetical protein